MQKHENIYIQNIVDSRIWLESVKMRQNHWPLVSGNLVITCNYKWWRYLEISFSATPKTPSISIKQRPNQSGALALTPLPSQRGMRVTHGKIWNPVYPKSKRVGSLQLSVSSTSQHSKVTTTQAEWTGQSKNGILWSCLWVAGIDGVTWHLLKVSSLGLTTPLPSRFCLRAQVLRLCTGFVIFVPRYRNYRMWFHLVWFCLLWYDSLISMSETFRNHSSCNRQTRGTVDRDWATVAKAAQDTPASIQTSSCKQALIYWY